MEMMILVPVILLMGCVAVAMALHEKAVPTLAVSPVAGTLPRIAPISLAAAQSLNLATHEARTAETGTIDGADVEHEDNIGRPVLSQTDVLLADALTEMIGLKAELFRLRSKVDNLNTEVARLTGKPNPTPPAASKKPVQLRRVA